MTTFDDLARRRAGYVDRPSLLEIGVSQETIERLIEQQHWQRPHPGVYKTGSAPPNWEDRLRAACLAAGPQSRAMGRTAARLRGLDGAERQGIIVLTVPVGHGPVPAGVFVHRTRRIDPALTDTISGIPLSNIGQTLLEYCWLMPVRLMREQAVEDAIRRFTSEGALRRFLGTCGRGVNGVTNLRDVLDHRLDGRPARSGFEVITSDILREYDVRPLPERRPLVKVPPDDVFELDLAYVALKIDIEPMGKKFHGTTTRQLADARRRRILESLGWLIIEVTWDEAILTPWVVAQRVRDALLCRSTRA